MTLAEAIQIPEFWYGLGFGFIGIVMAWLIASIMYYFVKNWRD